MWIFLQVQVYLLSVKKWNKVPLFFFIWFCWSFVASLSFRPALFPCILTLSDTRRPWRLVSVEEILLVRSSTHLGNSMQCLISKKKKKKHQIVDFKHFLLLKHLRCLQHEIMEPIKDTSKKFSVLLELCRGLPIDRSRPFPPQAPSYCRSSRRWTTKLC